MKFHQHFVASAIGLFFGTFFTVTIASVAQAAPIPLFGGTVDASLRLYDQFIETGTVLRRDYVLGTDFFPGVPPSATVYHKEFEGAAFSSFFFPPRAASLESGCDDSPLPTHFFRFDAFMVVRGGCTFNEKWLNIQDLFAAGIVVNNVPTGVGALGGITSDASIPFFFVTAEVGAELRGGSVIDFGEPIPGLAIITMSVTWTPNVVPVPEPSTLALALLGVLGIVFGRRSVSKPRAAHWFLA